MREIIFFLFFFFQLHIDKSCSNLLFDLDNSSVFQVCWRGTQDYLSRSSPSKYFHTLVKQKNSDRWLCTCPIIDTHKKRDKRKGEK